jgi:AraC family transcriptional regulator
MHSQAQAAYIQPRELEATPPAVSSAETIYSDPGTHDEALLSVARLIQEAGQMLWSDTARTQCCMQQAIVLLSENRPTVVSTPARKGSNISHLAPWQIAQALIYVDENLAEKITLRQLADTTRLSRSYFSRAFRATMGERPHTFVTRRRICRARNLLLSTEMQLSEVALECGLADQAHLSRVFRRYVGISPAVWRKMHRNVPLSVGLFQSDVSDIRQNGDPTCGNGRYPR